MNEQIFAIGIGGTGMRSLEAFVHTCAMGMYPNTEINLLALDTDLENGNFKRLQSLVEDAYLKIKGFNKTHYPLSDTFFSAKLNFHKFTPDYSKIDINGKFSSITDMMYATEQERDLAKLLLTESVREFDLKHGYRAQTHLGSFLMYHGIIDEVKKNPHGELAKYIQRIFDASESGSARVFVFGSVFGGTGASSIPIIPKAFGAAVNEMIPGKSLSKVHFGAVLLSAYFKFPTPDEKQRAAQKVVADAKNFALNSQVAMMFYNEDKTVKSTYRKFYMMGTPTNDFETEQKGKETITGGQAQKNDSHYIELLAAFAGYDFFNTPLEELKEIETHNKEVKYYYRALNESGKVDFKDFVPPAKVSEFAKRIGMLTAFTLFAYPEFTDFVAAAQSGSLAKNSISGYEDIDPAETEAIKRYCELFHFSVTEQTKITNGWLRQLHGSAGGSDKFLFHADLFGFNSVKELKKLKFNANLYRPNDTDVDKHKFSTGIFGSPYDSFKDAFVKTPDDDSITNKSEKLIKRMYKTLESLYEF